MTRQKLITAAARRLGTADGAERTGNLKEYTKQMRLLLDLLIKELVGSAPGKPYPPAKHFNPEQVLEEIAIAIKHRTISHTHRWKIVYYHTRLTCVPIEVEVPERIVLHEFTESMVHQGFSLAYWNHLKQNVIKLYKELEP